MNKLRSIVNPALLFHERKIIIGKFARVGEEVNLISTAKFISPFHRVQLRYFSLIRVGAHTLTLPSAKMPVSK